MDDVGLRTLGAAQRTIPTWARGRLNAMLIMVSQGAMALGGVIWGSAATIAGPSSTLFWAAVLFLGSLVLARRLSINAAENLKQRVLIVPLSPVEAKEVAPIALTEELVAA
jgi:Transmembrane secretion effector